MAERGTNDRSNKTLRAYLVYDYILKKTTSDRFQIGKLNAYLEAYGIKCDNRAIARDIEAINQAYIMLQNELNNVDSANEALKDKDNNFIIHDATYGEYRINQAHLKLDDISMISECIGAARFISDKKTQQLIDVLIARLHPKDAKEIKRTASKVQREKIESRLLYSNLNKIREVLYPKAWFGYERECCEKLTFYYLTYSIDRIGKPFEKQSREYCTAYPHQIVNKNGLYYLIAYDETKRKMRAFRIDRMIDVVYDYDEKRSGVRLAGKMDFPTLTSRTFDMCFGESTRVTIQFSNDAFDEVFERFGTNDVLYRKCDDKHFEATVLLDVSPKFFGWLCGFGKDSKLISPPAVVDEFYNYVDKIKSQYDVK